MTEPQDEPIYVTSPLLPPLDEFIPYLEKIWDSRVLTNGGPLHQQLETQLASYLGVPFLCLFNNGTNALLTALQALGVKGEVITTPYSFAATAHAVLWNGLKPVFVDIDSETFNMDPAVIEAAITPRTSAILPVHCYGRACDVVKIAEIGKRRSLKVVYDAAHAFGVKKDGHSLLLHGDLAVLSFHATKVFNTLEGGAIVCHDAATKKRIDQLKNFGIVSEGQYDGAGLNGKMNEVQAAFGLLQMKYVDAAIASRRSADRLYRSLLSAVTGIRVPVVQQGVETNAAYFPVLVDDDFPVTRDQAWTHLHQNYIFARRYFYPLLSDLPCYSEAARSTSLSRAKAIAERVLCLPMYPTLSEDDIRRVVSVLIESR